MSENEHSFHLRLPKNKYQCYRKKAEEAGISLNAYILMCLELYHNPLPSQQFPDIRLKEIEIKLDKMREEQQDLIQQDIFVREQAAQHYHQIKDREKIQAVLVESLVRSGVPLSDLTLAHESKQDADIVLVVLSYLEQNHIAILFEKNRYFIKNDGVNWYTERSH